MTHVDKTKNEISFFFGRNVNNEKEQVNYKAINRSLYTLLQIVTIQTEIVSDKRLFKIEL